MIKRFNLPSYIKGKSFAEASKLIQKKFADRDDKVSQDTMNALLGRLRDAQESVKQENNPQSQEQVQPQMQQAPQNGQFEEGGPMFTIKGGQGVLDDFTEQNPGMKSPISDISNKPGVGAYLGAATTAMDFGNQIFGKTGIDMTGNSNEQEVSGGMAAASGIMKGAQAGMNFGPWGAAAGAVLGGVSGIIGSKRKNEDIMKAQTNKVHRNYNMEMQTYEKGGYMNKYSGLDNPPKYMTSKLGGLPLPDFNNFLTPYDKYGASRFGADFANMDNEYFSSKLDEIRKNVYKPTAQINNDLNSDFTINKDLSKFTEQNSNMKSSSDGTFTNGRKFNDTKVGSFLDNNKGALRYAPIAMNAYQLATMKKPEVERLNRLDNRYKPQYVDERRLMNSINEGFGSGYATEGSGGSLARYNTLARASQLGKTKAISDAYIKASDVNRSEDRTAQSFNKATDTVNLQQSNREKDINARNRAAYKNNKSKFLSTMGTDIGQIGKEYLYKDQAENIFGYDWKGKYKKQNPNATDDEVKAAEKEAILKLKNKKK